MRTVLVPLPGGPERLVLADRPIPEPAPGEVRVRVHAAALNPVDVAMRTGALTDAGLVAPDGPLALGWDAAGVVDAVGPGVESVARGDAVIGLRDLLSAPSGTHADFVVLDADAVAEAPRNVDARAASTLPLNGLTALQALDLLALDPGQTVLVTGAAGGVGGFAVQLARLRGLHVVASASARDEELVRSLGASAFVARTASLGAAVRAQCPGGVDGAVDAALVGVRALDAVRRGGAFVALAAGAAPVGLRGIRVENVWIRASGGQLASLVRQVEAGELTLRVACTIDLADAQAAHRRLETERLSGRIVLVP